MQHLMHISLCVTFLAAMNDGYMRELLVINNITFIIQCMFKYMLRIDVQTRCLENHFIIIIVFVINNDLVSDCIASSWLSVSFINITVIPDIIILRYLRHRNLPQLG